MRSYKLPIGLLSLAILSLFGSGTLHGADQAKPGPVQVFILAGDSNCEGKAATKLMENLLADPATAATYKHLQAAEGKWAERDDVWIRYLDRHGKLTVGYGCAPTQFGIELQLGNVLGDRLKNQVLLIKTAWGGSGLSRKFNAPSAGMPAGELYLKMIADVKDTLKDMKNLFPA